MPIFNLRGRGQEKEKWRGEGGNYSREAIILNILVKEGDYLREAIDRGMDGYYSRKYGT